MKNKGFAQNHKNILDIYFSSNILEYFYHLFKYVLRNDQIN
jgi:hypothetical protein